MFMDNNRIISKNLFVSTLSVAALFLFNCTSTGPNQLLDSTGFNVIPKADQSQTVSPTVGHGKDFRAFCTAGYYIFAGAYEGGIFRSSDNGSTWAEVNSGLTISRGRCSPTILSFAVIGNNIFAGTGYNQGLFLSTDYGESWIPVKTVIPDISTFDYLGFPALTVYRSAIYAACDKGVYRSFDSGKTWTSASHGLSAWTEETYGQVNVYTPTSFVECDGELFAGTHNGIYLFTENNGFPEWRCVSSSITPSGLNAGELAVTGSDLFAATDAGLYRSNNKGENWEQINLGTRDQFFNTVYASGDRLYASTQYESFRSMDNGASWTVMDPFLSDLDVDTYFQTGNAILAGTQIGGILRSTDNGLTWTTVYSTIIGPHPGNIPYCP
jgi:photosystem II stability/assembly factor-like uncharacterized protein